MGLAKLNSNRMLAKALEELAMLELAAEEAPTLEAASEEEPVEVLVSSVEAEDDPAEEEAWAEDWAATAGAHPAKARIAAQERMGRRGFFFINVFHCLGQGIFITYTIFLFLQRMF